MRVVFHNRKRQSDGSNELENVFQKIDNKNLINFVLQKLSFLYLNYFMKKHKKIDKKKECSVRCLS